MMSSEFDDGSESPNPFGKPAFIIAAAVVVVLVLVGGFLLLTGGDDRDDSPEAGAQPKPGATSATSAAPAGGASACGLEANDTNHPVKAGPEATWEYVGYTAYPVSKTFGPTQTSPEGYRFCFQHSPEGALFYAAYNLAEQVSVPEVMTNEGYRDHVRAWAEFATSDGKFRKKLTTIDETNLDIDPALVEGLRYSTVGFRILMYEGDHAVIDLLTERQSDGQSQYVSNSIKLVWTGSDWKLDGDLELPISTTDIASPTGYVNWGEQTQLPIGDDE
jgi:hypothetical protein